MENHNEDKIPVTKCASQQANYQTLARFMDEPQLRRAAYSSR